MVGNFDENLFEYYKNDKIKMINEEHTHYIKEKNPFNINTNNLPVPI